MSNGYVCRKGIPHWLWIGVLALVMGLAAEAHGQGPRRASLEPRVPAGKCQSTTGRLLSLSNGLRGWQTVAKDADVMSRDLLLVLPGMQAIVEPRPHSLTLELQGGLPGAASFPVWESEVVLHDSRAFDVDFTLRRGRVILTNRKEKGPARIWVRLASDAWQLELPKPGDSLALAMYGRWPTGVSFSKNPAEDEPTRIVGMWVLKGQVDVKTGRQDYSLAAPPGPAYLQWDSVVGSPDGPRKLEQLPDWTKSTQNKTPAIRAFAAAVKDYEKRLKSATPVDALLGMLEQAGEIRGEREFALVSLTALDVIVPVAEALANPHSADGRAVAVLALRHWIGSAPGNDQRLYRLLIDRLEYRPAQAETILQLLHSPYASNDPDTYEILIAYLKHGSLAVRELAAWHLTRLVRAGRDIRYDPAGSAAERERGYKAWKKLIPPGQLPPREKEKK